MFEEAVEERPAFLEEILTSESESAGGVSASSGDLLTRLRETPADGREDLLASFLQEEVKAVLRLPSTPEPSVGFFDLGMDSLMAVELRNRLNRTFSGEYTASNTVVFDYPDIAAMARHLSEELGQMDPAPTSPTRTEPATAPFSPIALPSPPAVQLPAARPGRDGIAIVGMACRFPGARNIRDFWRQLETGADAVTDHRPEEAIRKESFQHLSTAFAPYAKGGFVDDIDQFDAKFFRVSPIEASTMDPRHRMLLETSWLAIEDAGIDPHSLRGSRTGVFVGISTSEYRDLMASSGEISYLGTAQSTAVGRISFQLGLEGPTVPLELNCASSLVAVHQAVVSLRRGESDLALVGGVQALLSGGITKEMAILGMLSSNGLCRAFDAAADGFVRGEGCGMVVLKRLKEAESDGDRILGVIRGTAVNQNGVSAGPTVPYGPAQERVIQAALIQAGVSPSQVDYLEAHGAGSQLGDSIEAQAAASVYGEGRGGETPLLIGSVKTNIGHLEPAAGVAGLIKAVLAMRKGVIPKSLHFRTPNPNLDWERLPIRIVSELRDWPEHEGRPPRSGVSAFGISGVNAHAIVEGYRAQDPEASDEVGPRPARILPLSAKSNRALRDLAERYLKWLEERAQELFSKGESADSLLSDLAWTAGVGRAHHARRAGLVFSDLSSLKNGLKAVAEGAHSPATEAYPGSRATIARLEDSSQSEPTETFLEEVAAAYEAGLSVPFQGLFSGQTRRRIALPGYPFQRKSYWYKAL